MIVIVASDHSWTGGMTPRAALLAAKNARRIDRGDAAANALPWETPIHARP